MLHRLIVFYLLFSTEQSSTKAIHRTMSSFDDPTMSFEVRVFIGIRHLFTGLDMRLVAAALSIGFQPDYIVTFVQAEPEFLSRTPRLKSIECICNQFDVMRVCCCNNQRQGKPVGVCNRLRFTPCFPLFVGFRPVFLFLIAVIWLCRRPLTTMTSQDHPDVHRQANRFAKSAQRYRHHAILGSSGAQNSMNISR